MMPTADIEAAPTSKNSLWTYGFFLGVGALAIALRTPELSSKGLWLDEAYSVLTARLPLMEMLEKLSGDATPPLYYVILAPWVRLFGPGEAAARALSIVFSIGGIALMGLLSFRYFSLRIASVVTLILPSSRCISTTRKKRGCIRCWLCWESRSSSPAWNI
jgi:4-amino-4-deoxy-L-arabinose transferase-like glycosyltransferase